jgi:hypothetical protein
MKLWLDDVREPPNRDEWEWVQTPWMALSFILYVGEGCETWSLDHDLGKGIPTGYELLCMVE